MSMSYGLKVHDMEHSYDTYQDAMNNSQKPAPVDPDKKQSQECADNYTGTNRPEQDFGY